MSERPRYPKSTCAVLGCPKWSRMFPGEWMCGKHWRMAPLRCRRALKKVWRRIADLRAYDAATIRSSVPESEWREWRRLDRLEPLLWGHAKRAAVLRSAGL